VREPDVERNYTLPKALGPPLPRITRLMALAIQLDRRIARENLDCSELARCVGMSLVHA
jgi:hypothetical protein